MLKFIQLGIIRGALKSEVKKASGDGSTWIIGTDSAPYLRVGNNWVKKKGCIKDISVDPKGSPWAIGCDKQPYQWDGSNWIARGG